MKKLILMLLITSMCILNFRIHADCYAIGDPVAYRNCKKEKTRNNKLSEDDKKYCCQKKGDGHWVV